GGYLNIAGRIKDMGIRGGGKGYPREGGGVLYTPPGVEGVQGIGGPHAQNGGGPGARGGVAPGARLTRGGAAGGGAGPVAPFTIPRYLRITEDFRMTVTGKVQKFVMREVSVGELGLGDADRTPTA